MGSTRIRLAAVVLVVLATSNSARAAMGLRSGARAGQGPVTVAASLTAEELASLQYMREEEKLARDIYVALYSRWGMVVFSRISESEQRHTDAIRALLEKYGAEDPAVTTPPGRFVNPELQQLYDSLLAMGLASGAAAVAVGVLVEETDIADLQEAMALTTKTDLRETLSNLLQASSRHLAVFTEWST